MGTTANEALPYPESTSSTNLWEHFESLADAVDAALTKRVGRGIMADPTSTSSDGTATSSNVDTRDAVLGNYVFTAEAGRRYKVTYSGMLLNGSVANDRFICRIRDGNSSTPSSAAPEIAQASGVCTVTGSNGRVSLVVSTTYTPSAGTHTLSAFLQRFNGSGIGTPVGTRELYVEDIGPA